MNNITLALLLCKHATHTHSGLKKMATVHAICGRSVMSDDLPLVPVVRTVRSMALYQK